MKQLWTTCYARAGKMPHDWLKVQTSNVAPKWWQPANRTFLPDLAPEAMRKVWAGAKMTDGEFDADYIRQLNRLLRSGKLRQMIDGLPENAVFLCYEADCADCHRSTLAQFINQNGLAQVDEWVSKPKEKPEGMAQPCLL